MSRCIERIPADIRYIHERAKAYQMIAEGQTRDQFVQLHQNAVDDFSAVIKRNPKNANAHFRRAFS